MNYLGRDLSKYVQDLYEKDHKTMTNKVKEEINK